MNDWQRRVIDEKDELKDKCDKLQSFLISSHASSLDGDDVYFLNEQLGYMLSYLNILYTRIQRFK